MLRRSLLPGVLAILMLAGSLSAQSRAVLDEIERVLSGLVRDPTVPSGPAATRLIRLGAPVGPGLVLAAEHYRDRRTVEAAVGALEKVAPAHLDEYLLKVVAGSGQEPGRVVAWAALGDSGGQETIPLVVATFDDGQGFLKGAAERALVKLLRRHDRRGTAGTISRALEDLGEESRARVICSLGQSSSPQALHLLLNLIGRWPSLNHAVVAAISRMRGVLPATEVVPHLLPALEADDPGVRREAVTALGVFGHSGSVETLIALLSEETAGIGDNAHWALRNLSGERFPPVAVRWNLWFEAEKAWWEAQSARLLVVLKSRDAEEILAGLDQVSLHLVFLDRFEAALGDLLDHLDREVRTRAAALLGREPSMSPAAAPSAKAALESCQFRPVRVAPPRVAPPPPEERPESGGVSILGIGGLLVILVLCLRIFGLQLFDWVTGVWRSSGPEKGPMVVKLSGQRWRTPSAKG